MLNGEKQRWVLYESLGPASGDQEGCASPLLCLFLATVSQ